jgi:hypothetical protein
MTMPMPTAAMLEGQPSLVQPQPSRYPLEAVFFLNPLCKYRTGKVILRQSEPQGKARALMPRQTPVLSKLKCPVFLASEVSGLVFLIKLVIE